MTQELIEAMNKASRNTALEEIIWAYPSIMPVMLEKAEEGRQARFNQYLEAHLKEFWPDWGKDDDAEYLQNYIDPLRDPDRAWNL